MIIKMYVLPFLFVSEFELIYCDGRCEEQMGEQFLGKEVDCAEEKGCT